MRYGWLMGVCAVLAACSQQEQPAPTPSPTTARPTSPDDHIRPVLAQQKTFGDWIVGCDNIRRCAMASLGPDGGDFPAVTMQVARNAGPDGGFEIALGSTANDTPTPATLVVGERRFAVAGDGLTGAAARDLAAAIANGDTLAVLDAKGATTGRISLKGANAALRYIDAGQGRAGTVTAIVARGARPASVVSAPAPLPRVKAVAFTGTPTALTPAQVTAMRRTAQCDADLPSAAPRLHALADGTTLVLLPCSAGAYNEIDALFVVRDGKAAPAMVDAPAGFDATGADSETPVRSVVNGDVEGGALTSYAKGRGLGDCGVRQRFVWDGERLRLIEQSAMGECRGNPDYLPVWRAKAIR